MQTLEATKRLSDLDRDMLVRRLKTIFARWEKGNVEGMLELATHDVVCYPASTWNHARYCRPIHGKAAVLEAFRQRAINYDRAASILHRILIDGDEAVVHRTVTLRERGSGQSHTFDCVNFFRFRDGLIAEFQEFPDGSAYEAVVYFPH